MNKFAPPLLLLLICSAILVQMATGCTSNLECNLSQCCAKNYITRNNECKDKGSQVGDRCGGDFKCGCLLTRGLVCVEDTSFLGNFRTGKGSCHQIAVGTK